MCSVRIRQLSPARGPPVPRGDDDRGGYERIERDALRPASDTSGAAAAAGARTTAALYAVALVHATAVLDHGTGAFACVPTLILVLIHVIRPTAGFDRAIGGLGVGLHRQLERNMQRVPCRPLLPQSYNACFGAFTRTSPPESPIANEHAPRIYSNV